MPTDERLVRDLAKAAGPTDNSGRPVTAPQYDKFTFVPPSRADVVEDKVAEAERLVEHWKGLHAVSELADADGYDGALYAIAADVLGLQPWEGPDRDEAEVYAATGAVDSAVYDEPRGDTVVSDVGMPGPFPTAPEAPRGT